MKIRYPAGLALRGVERKGDVKWRYGGSLRAKRRVARRCVRFTTAAAIRTTDLPLSEWTKVVANARLCQALPDRLTERAHILETDEVSYRFRGTPARREKTG